MTSVLDSIIEAEAKMRDCGVYSKLKVEITQEMFDLLVRQANNITKTENRSVDGYFLGSLNGMDVYISDELPPGKHYVIKQVGQDE